MAYYLKFDAITKGESKAKGHEGDKGWIEVDSVKFGSGRGIHTRVGHSSKREATAPNISEVMVTKQLDGTSPLLFQESLVGKGTTAKLDLVETGEDQLSTFLEVTLHNAMISGYSVAGKGDRPQETININFTKIEYKYTPHDDQHKPGSSVAVGYDLTLATSK